MMLTVPGITTYRPPSAPGPSLTPRSSLLLRLERRSQTTRRTGQRPRTAGSIQIKRSPSRHLMIIKCVCRRRAKHFERRFRSIHQHQRRVLSTPRSFSLCCEGLGWGDGLVGDVDGAAGARAILGPV